MCREVCWGVGGGVVEVLGEMWGVGSLFRTYPTFFHTSHLPHTLPYNSPTLLHTHSPLLPSLPSHTPHLFTLSACSVRCERVDTKALFAVQCFWRENYVTSMQLINTKVSQLVAYLSSYHEKAINALYELACELPAICLPHQDGEIPLSAFPNGTTSKLAGLFSTLSL